MSKPAAADRPRAAIAIALAIMLLACGLIVTALALLAQGAVATEGSTAPAAAAREFVSKQSDIADGSAVSPRRTPEERTHRGRGRSVVSGSFALGAEPTADELPLEARIAESSVGGGYIAEGRIHVVVAGAPADPAQP